MREVIYAITCAATGEQYVGQTYQPWRRWREHKYKLRSRVHPTPRLQAAWDTYGEDAFTFAILEELYEDDPRTLHEAEREWVHRLRPVFNVTQQEADARRIAAWA